MLNLKKSTLLLQRVTYLSAQVGTIIISDYKVIPRLTFVSKSHITVNLLALVHQTNTLHG